MLAADIASYETSTHNFHNSAGRLSASTEGAVSVFDYNPGYSSYFVNSNTTKRRIVLHFTAGYLGGDLSTLTTQNYRVSVSFVVARSGRIYRLFPTNKWAYHTGSGTIGGNTDISSTSIGIEISNIGYLEEAGSWMWAYTGSRYCRVSETQYYQRLSNPYRGKSIFASYTMAQYEAVRSLIDVLCAKHSIPRSFLPVSSRFDKFPSSTLGRSFEGICSHINYRPSGKWDIGPAFDWNRIA